MRRLISCFAVALVMLCTASCSPTHDFDAGRPISREELESMSAALFVTDVPTEVETYPPGTVFWTEGGSVYHRDRACRHLAKAIEVKSGYVSNARMYGKDRPCSTCGGEDDTE